MTRDIFDELLEELGEEPEHRSSEKPTVFCTGLPSGDLCLFCDDRGRCHCLKGCKYREEMKGFTQ